MEAQPKEVNNLKHRNFYILFFLLVVASHPVETYSQNALYIDSSEKPKLEAEYQKAYCKGEIEHRLPDRTRVDCLTDTHAIEYDWASKWAEAVGQSLYYAFQTNKKAGIVLIYKKPSDVRYYHRLMSVIQHNKLDIEVWIVGNTK